VDHDQTESELTVARRRRAAWDIQELLGIGLIVAIALLATAYVAAGIMEAGASPGPNQIEATLLYATEWVSPYLVLFPLAALALAAWSVASEFLPSGEGNRRGERDRPRPGSLARARVLITITASHSS